MFPTPKPLEPVNSAAGISGDVTFSQTPGVPVAGGSAPPAPAVPAPRHRGRLRTAAAAAQQRRAAAAAEQRGACSWAGPQQEGRHLRALIVPDRAVVGHVSACLLRNAVAQPNGYFWTNARSMT